jgi:hypothetical protein
MCANFPGKLRHDIMTNQHDLNSIQHLLNRMQLGFTYIMETIPPPPRGEGGGFTVVFSWGGGRVSKPVGFLQKELFFILFSSREERVGIRGQ